MTGDADLEGVTYQFEVRVEKGTPCPECGREVLRTERSWLPPVAFKQEMFDACYFDTDDLERSWRGNTAVAYHEEVGDFV